MRGQCRIVALLAFITKADGYGPAVVAPRSRVALLTRSSADVVARLDDGSPPPTARPWRSAAATLGVFAASLLGGVPVVGGPAAAWATEGTAVAESAAPARSLNAAQRKRLKLALKAKLAKIPVFMVTNDGGSPFLNQLASGDQSALITALWI